MEQKQDTHPYTPAPSPASTPPLAVYTNHGGAIHAQLYHLASAGRQIFSGFTVIFVVNWGGSERVDHRSPPLMGRMNLAARKLDSSPPVSRPAD